MNFRVVLQNDQPKIIQCPSDIGVWRFLVRYDLKAKAVRPVETLNVDLVLDEDGFDPCFKDREVVEDWCG